MKSVDCVRLKVATIDTPNQKSNCLGKQNEEYKNSKFNIMIFLVGQN